LQDCFTALPLPDCSRFQHGWLYGVKKIVTPGLRSALGFFSFLIEFGAFLKFPYNYAVLRKLVSSMLIFSAMKRANQSTGAMTLPEVLVAILLLAIFCGSVFELNAVCLRYIDASKESLAALQSVHDRSEVLRNLSFSDLTTTGTVQSLLSNPANSSEFCKKATEVVKLSAYPTASGVTQFTRTPDGAVTLNSTATSLGSTLVQLDVSTSWNMLGGRARSEETSTIISNGTKK
jgi:Tfp pilus assembly protein PilV